MIRSSWLSESPQLTLCSWKSLDSDCIPKRSPRNRHGAKPKRLLKKSCSRRLTLPSEKMTWRNNSFSPNEYTGTRSALRRTTTTRGSVTGSVLQWDSMRLIEALSVTELVKTADLSPSKNYILGVHPHGIMCAGGYTCFSTEGCGFAEAFPGMRSSLAVLSGLFRIPLFREYIMASGGAEESLSSAPGVHAVVMRQRKGFVRMALQYGADLVPVYSFGENELFRQVIFLRGLRAPSDIPEAMMYSRKSGIRKRPLSTAREERIPGNASANPQPSVLKHVSIL
ncbi:hypothetical protein CRUP_037587 [Coryphaenoides rupestris]|nr:hypothetical protein CRUP_037587 [Coryphaenoides rupestris]